MVQVNLLPLGRGLNHPKSNKGIQPTRKKVASQILRPQRAADPQRYVAYASWRLFMNPTLMEELLNEDENSTLDFKRDQYPFDKASDEQKSELLKDILAFANAWRRTDAFLLVGVEDVKGGRSNVLGVASHFDDANIQQFVNSKTNRPVTFSYEVFPFEGSQLSVFHLPLQDRPIYLKNNFGKLRQQVVYLRRGSSTGTADPDEVAKMGTLKIREVLGELSSQPKLNPVLQALYHDRDAGNVVLAHVAQYAHHVWRMECKVIDANELHATFESTQGTVSSSIEKITVSYEPTMKLRMYTLAPFV